MFRFTIRDVLWLTALVAMGVAWWLDHASLGASRVAIRDHAIKLRTSFSNVKKTHVISHRGAELIEPGWRNEILEMPDWQLAEKPIPK